MCVCVAVRKGDITRERVASSTYVKFEVELIFQQIDDNPTFAKPPCTFSVGLELEPVIISLREEAKISWVQGRHAGALLFSKAPTKTQTHMGTDTHLFVLFHIVNKGHKLLP